MKIRRHRRQSCDSLWNKLSQKMRKKIGRCEVCGCTTNLHVHHLLSRASFPSCALNTNNLIVVCDQCHTKGKNSFHNNPIWALEWLKMNKLEQYEWMINTMNIFQNV